MSSKIHHFNFDTYKCNVCGRDAEYTCTLELVWTASNYQELSSNEGMPFYLCAKHEYLYGRLQKSVSLTEYFSETVNANK